MRLRALEHLALAESHRRGAEEVDGLGRPGADQLRERARQQIVPGGDRGGRAVAVGHRGLAAPELGAVEHVVVDERGHVQQFDGRGGAQDALPRRLPAPGAEQREQRTHALAAGAERGAARLAELAGVLRRHRREALLHELEPACEPALLRGRGPAQGGPRAERRPLRSARQPGHGGCSPPAPLRRGAPRRRSRSAGSGRPARPAPAMMAASSSALGNAATEAGR